MSTEALRYLLNLPPPNKAMQLTRQPVARLAFPVRAVYTPF